MLGLIQDSKDPFFNLATEDYLLHNRNEDFFILSVNEPSVIIGKHQVAHTEVREKETASDGIHVLRRISGGGAVYHDSGNLNFAFIRQSEQGKQVDFRFYTQPVIDFLASAEITAVFEGKNDLTVNGLKISGNAEHVFRERVLHHGTLLFDASLTDMKKYLKPSSSFYSSRGVPSNRTSVTNLKSMLPGVASMEQFIKLMTGYFLETNSELELISLTESEKKTIFELADSKYRTWEWIWGYGPAYTFSRELEIAGKKHSCRLLVKDGIIWESEITGSPEMKRAAKFLIGCRHMNADMLKLFRKTGVQLTDEDVSGFF
jgi:lipoate---protein ligase